MGRVEYRGYGLGSYSVCSAISPPRPCHKRLAVQQSGAFRFGCIGSLTSNAEEASDELLPGFASFAVRPGGAPL